MKIERLSSDNLYHFKSDLTVLKAILSNGFRHNLWQESIPYEKTEQQNYIVCFCDIKIQDAIFHRQVYGDNAIVLTKSWAIKNGVSPVRYIHSKSPGLSDDYVRNKKILREVRIKTEDHPDTLVQDYSLFSILIDKNRLTSENLEKQIKQDSTIFDELEQLESEYKDLFEKLKTSGGDVILVKYFRSLVNRVLELHNELEHRDAFMRAYSQDFTHPSSGVSIKEKILYDEKEWRSIRFAKDEDYFKSLISKFLPDSYNLRFGDDDVLAILFTDFKSLEETKEYLRKNQTLLDYDKTESKLSLIDNYKESIN